MCRTCALSRHRIIATAGKRMAAQQSSSGEQTPTDDAVTRDGFHRVLRTRRHESAGLRQHRRDESLIAPQHDLNRLLHFCSTVRARCAANRKPRATSSTNSAKGKRKTLFRGLNTTSTGPSHAPHESRTASRIRRRIPLRSTDSPNTLPTVNPTRGPAPASGPQRRR